MASGMSALTEFLTKAQEKGADAAEFSERVGNHEDQHYAYGVADFAGFLLARIENDLPFEMSEDDKGRMRATNGQLAEVLLFEDDE